MRPLNIGGVQLIEDVKQSLPTLVVSEAEIDVYVSDRRELEQALDALNPDWPRLLAVDSGEGGGPDPRHDDPRAG
jgi:hypothetical protein